MKHLEKIARKKLGEILLDEGLISKSQLADAEREQAASGELLGSILVDTEYITEWDLAKTVSTQYQLPFINLGGVSRSREAQFLLDGEDLKKRRCVPIEKFGEVVTLAVAEMPDMDFIYEFAERTNLTPFLYVSTSSDILSVAEEIAGANRPGPGKPTPRMPFEDEPSSPAPPPPRPPAASTPEPSPVPEPVAMDVASEGLAVLDQVLPDEPAPVRKKVEPKIETRAPSPQTGNWEDIFDAADEALTKEQDD